MTGVASIRWVRPDLTTPANSSALAASASPRIVRAGVRSSTTASVIATCMAVGNVSLLDWLALTWSLGCTAASPSAAERATRLAITSLAFMLELVPDPVWNTSMGKCSSWRPSATSRAAETMAEDCSSVITSSSPLVCAAAAFTWPRAWIRRGSRVVPLIGKLSTARCVWARHRAVLGTSISPMESCSIRTSSCVLTPRTLPTGSVPDLSGT